MEAQQESKIQGSVTYQFTDRNLEHNHFFDEGIAYCQKQQFEKAYQCFKKHLAQNSFCQKTFHMLSYCCYKFSEIHRNNVNDISVITKHPKSCKGINKVPKNKSSALSLNLRSSKIQDKCTFFNDDLENLNPTKYKGQKKLIKNFRNLRPSKKNQKSFQYESEPPLIISPCVNESHKVRKSSSSNSISVGSCRNNHSSTKSILKQMADHQLKIELFLSKIDRTLSNIELEVNHLLTKERKFNSKVSNLLHLVSHGDSFFETKTDEMQKNSKAVSKKNVVTLYQPSQFATELAYWPFPYWYGENFVNSVLGDSTAQVNLCSPYFGNKNVHEERGSAENIVQIADCSSWPKQETDALVEYCLQATPKDETDALVESYVQATPKEETDALVESYVQATLNQETNALVESYEQALNSLLSENDCSQPQKLSKGKLGCDAPLVTLTPSFKRKLDFSETYIHCLPRKKLQLSTLLNRAIAKRKLISAEKTVDSKRQKIQSSNQSFGRPSLLSRGVALKMYKELQLLRDLSIGVVSTGCGNILGKSSRERQFIGASHKTIMKIINPSFQCIKSAPVQMKPTISCSLEYLAELSLDLCSSSSVVSLPNSGSILPVSFNHKEVSLPVFSNVACGSNRLNIFINQIMCEIKDSLSFIPVDFKPLSSPNNTPASITPTCEMKFELIPASSGYFTYDNLRLLIRGHYIEFPNVRVYQVDPFWSDRSAHHKTVTTHRDQSLCLIQPQSQSEFPFIYPVCVLLHSLSTDLYNFTLLAGPFRIRFVNFNSYFNAKSSNHCDN